MKVINWLGEHYIFGMGMAFGTGAIGYIESLTLIFRFFTVLFGAIIGALTLYKLIKNLKK